MFAITNLHVPCFFFLSLDKSPTVLFSFSLSLLPHHDGVTHSLYAVPVFHFLPSFSADIPGCLVLVDVLLD